MPLFSECFLCDRGINYDLIEKLVVHICTAEQFRVEVPGEHGAANGGGALGGILIFLTGVGEVTRLCRQLESHHALANSSKVRSNSQFEHARSLDTSVHALQKAFVSA